MEALAKALISNTSTEAPAGLASGEVEAGPFGALLATLNQAVAPESASLLPESEVEVDGATVAPITDAEPPTSPVASTNVRRAAQAGFTVLPLTAPTPKAAAAAAADAAPADPAPVQRAPLEASGSLTAPTPLFAADTSASTSPGATSPASTVTAPLAAPTIAAPALAPSAAPQAPSAAPQAPTTAPQAPSAAPQAPTTAPQAPSAAPQAPTTAGPATTTPAITTAAPTHPTPASTAAPPPTHHPRLAPPALTASGPAPVTPAPAPVTPAPTAPLAEAPQIAQPLPPAATPSPSQGGGVPLPTLYPPSWANPSPHTLPPTLAVEARVVHSPLSGRVDVTSLAAEPTPPVPAPAAPALATAPTGTPPTPTLPTQVERPAPTLADAVSAAASLPEPTQAVATRPAPSGPQATLRPEALAQDLNAVIATGAKEARIQLRPRELGHVDVKLTFEPGQVDVVITARNEAGRQALAQELPALIEALRQADVPAVVRLADPDSSAGTNEHGDSGQDARAALSEGGRGDDGRRAPTPSAPASVDDDAPTHDPQPSDPAEGLDLLA